MAQNSGFLAKNGLFLAKIDQKVGILAQNFMLLELARIDWELLLALCKTVKWGFEVFSRKSAIPRKLTQTTSWLRKHLPFVLKKTDQGKEEGEEDEKKKEEEGSAQNKQTTNL